MKLLESIKIKDGVIYHLPYHQKRVNYSSKILNYKKIHLLHEHIVPPKNGLYRCRVVYDEDDLHIDYIPYTPKKILSLKTVYDDKIDYSLKYLDRSQLNRLYEKRQNCDDIIIVRNSLLTDTSIANIALFDGEKWFTPKRPLLYGVTRQRLLDNGKIFTKDIKITDLDRYGKYAIINAMIDFNVIENGIII